MTTRASSLLLRAGGEAGAGHAFAQATFVEKILFEPLVEPVTGLVNEADDDIGDDECGPSVALVLFVLLGFASDIAQPLQVFHDVLPDFVGGAEGIDHLF